MHKFRSWLYFFIAIINIVISIPLSKNFGGIGAAIGTAVAMIIGNGIIMNWYYHKRIHLNMIFFWRNIIQIIPSIIIPIMFGVYLIKFINLYEIKSFIISGIVLSLLYFISVYFFGMNKFEKKIINKPFICVIERFRFK